MANKDKYSLMFVYPAFKKKLKVEASKSNKSMIQLTKDLSESPFEEMEGFFKNDKKKFKI